MNKQTNKVTHTSFRFLSEQFGTILKARMNQLQDLCLFPRLLYNNLCVHESNITVPLCVIVERWGQKSTVGIGHAAELLCKCQVFAK